MNNNPTSLLERNLGLFGISMEDAHQALSRMGFGDTSTVKNALETSDKKHFGGLVEKAKDFAKSNPSMLDYVIHRLGV